MSFTEHRESFGTYAKVTIACDQGSSIAVIPDMGARLNGFEVASPDGPVEIVDGYLSSDELASEHFSKGSLLAPFPNRIADGAYEFESHAYQLPIDKPKENNAIHGFISDKPFQIVSSTAIDTGYTLVLAYDSQGGEGFPFPFTIRVMYVFRHNALTVGTELINTGSERMPVGFGWHPYFTTGEQVNGLMLQLPSLQEIEVDDCLIPTEVLVSNEAWSQARRIGETRFDTGFQFTGTINEISIVDVRKKLSIDVTCGEGYGYVQLFVPPSRGSIAVEPMTCAANAFNNGLGLKVLEPGESLSAEYTVTARSG